MKTKKIDGKLVLNKTTISRLDGLNMEKVRGGELTDDTCGSCHPLTLCLGCPSLMCPDERTQYC